MYPTLLWFCKSSNRIAIAPDTCSIKLKQIRSIDLISSLYDLWGKQSDFNWLSPINQLQPALTFRIKSIVALKME